MQRINGLSQLGFLKRGHQRSTVAPNRDDSFVSSRYCLLTDLRHPVASQQGFQPTTPQTIPSSIKTVCMHNLLLNCNQLFCSTLLSVKSLRININNLLLLFSQVEKTFRKPKAIIKHVTSLMEHFYSQSTVEARFSNICISPYPILGSVSSVWVMTIKQKLACSSKVMLS